MEIKRVNLVSNEDLKGLNRSLKFCIDSILAEKEQDALWTLMKIQGNLEKNLKEDKDA